ncbi:hypothetical protein GH714_021125 [Hevea brasiliensis]|uniref:t-SNARE coiled-coil homology domain-containing protein n=1 Tax=Hevea brasiliensis TaxID=3981 RepID=A0A6A6MFM4_HEVBR|nr:hypothetical protein GH714_021125 [Hevea brasiliensis]
MFGLKKSPLKIGKHSKVDPEYTDPPRSNPFDSDDELDNKQTLKPPRKTSSEPNLTAPNVSSNPFDDDEERGISSSSLYPSLQQLQQPEIREQITRTHNVAVEMDHDLSRGEKLLGNLGGMFSRTWKPKKTRPITGPVITRDDYPKTRGSHMEQREKLGLNPAPKGWSNTPTPLSEPTDALQKVEANQAMDHFQDDVDELNFRVKGANQRGRRLLGK